MTTILTHTIAALSGVCFGMWVTYWILTEPQNKKQNNPHLGDLKNKQ
jgi:hypothetical protein